MNVLMLTPDLDDGNPIVGFARTWVKRLATRVERLHVIPVMGGDSPASNVLVHSLGRERGQGKFCRLWNLYRIMAKVLRAGKSKLSKAGEALEALDLVDGPVLGLAVNKG